jgi:hypothetical protein
VYKKFPEISMEIDTPLEEKVSKIRKSIQGLRVKIVYLEAHTMPRNPPREREQREKTTTKIMEIIKRLEECAKLYEEITQVWISLTNDAELQGIGKKLQAMSEEAQKFKVVMSALPPAKNMVAITENRNLYLDITK